MFSETLLKTGLIREFGFHQNRDFQLKNYFLLGISKKNSEIFCIMKKLDFNIRLDKYFTRALKYQ